MLYKVKAKNISYLCSRSLGLVNRDVRRLKSPFEAIYSNRKYLKSLKARMPFNNALLFPSYPP